MVEKTIELTGTSANSIEDAVNLAVSRAAVTIENIRHLRVLDITRRRRRRGRSGAQDRCRSPSGRVHDAALYASPVAGPACTE